MMWLCCGGKTRPKKPGSGSGYGGSAVKDQVKLRKGRAKAAQDASNHDAAMLQFLIETKPLLSTTSVVDTVKLVSTLKEIFRNQAPADWIPKRDLFMESLACFRLVMSNNSDLLGNKDDRDSLNAVFHEFAEHVDFLEKRGEANEHTFMVKEVLEIRLMQPQSSQPQQNDQANVSVTNPHEVYRNALGPLRFGFVDKLEHHYYASHHQSGKLNMRKVFQELSSYKSSLPIEYGSSIVVRAVEDRVDLLRAMIIGPEDTPYANGCFFFDIRLRNYPNEPPQVRFLTTGGGTVRFNPNLYTNGKVCLSLLNTWHGPGWVSSESTLLQVLVSLQSMVFVAHPYFNEPFTGMFKGTSTGKKKTDAYNANIRRATLIYAVYPFVSGGHAYPEFAEAMAAHFRNKKMRLCDQMSRWLSADNPLASTVHAILNELNRSSDAPESSPVSPSESS